jgi:hypothetical protein
MHELVGMFLARLVVDECVYPAYLTDVRAEFAADSAAAATIGKAQSLLCGPHAFSRIEKGWGPGDGRPCEELKVAVATMADEYLASGDASEAQRCVIEMNAPYYHHEVVKRLVVKSFDRGEHERGLVHALLKQLYEAEVRQRAPVRCEAGRYRTDWDRMDARRSSRRTRCARALAVSPSLLKTWFAQSIPMHSVDPPWGSHVRVLSVALALSVSAVFRCRQ